MKTFKSYTYTWWQIGIFKLALLTIGAIIGSNWPAFFTANQTIMIVIAAVTSIYVISVSLRQ